ncbi:MAG: hypothetical protein JXQ29_13810, partial [Planctomycetes bacterium]|nr:hypothetical protein [Planctomycetota bacterium]
RARRLTLALAAAILLAILAAGAAYLWIDAGRRARVARATAAVTHALEDVASLRGAARAASVEDVAAWDKVRAALERAEAVAVQGDIEPATRDRLAALAAEVYDEDSRARAAAAQAAKDRAMVAWLDEIRLRAADLWDTPGDFEGPTDAAYAAAFRDYGIEVDALAPAEAAARVRATAISESLVIALDDWTSVRSRGQPPGGEPVWRRLLDVAQAADSNRFRRELRSARRERDVERARQLAGSEEALTLPAATQEYLASVLGSFGDVPGAIAYLEKARCHHPDDFWIHFNLGFWLTRSTPVQHDRVLEACRVAVGHQ